MLSAHIFSRAWLPTHKAITLVHSPSTPYLMR
jgi:hypothetical protein